MDFEKYGPVTINMKFCEAAKPMPFVAVTLCENEPLPEPLTALEEVTVDPPRAELEWYRRLDG